MSRSTSAACTIRAGAGGFAATVKLDAPARLKMKCRTDYSGARVRQASLVAVKVATINRV